MNDNTRTINDIVKVYPHMLKIVIYHRGYQLSSNNKTAIRERKEEKHQKHIDDNIHRSLRRTKTTIKDLILCNHFDYFCTFTFDRRKHNRYNIDHCKRVMSMWLNRQRKHSPHLKYLVVPELHKDGAVHFHALMANYNGNLKDTGKTTKYGAKIYNISSYRAGRISSAVPIDLNTEAVANYVLKQYLTKDMPLIYGRRRYFASQNLTRPITEVNGVFKLNLFQVIKNTKPAYINDTLEVQYYDTQGTKKLDDSTLALNLPF